MAPPVDADRRTQQYPATRMSGRPAPDRRIVAAYSEASWRARVHTRLRWTVAPLPTVAASVPTTGRVLDIGCGHGLFSLLVALESPSRRVLGVDVDDRKVASARAAADRAGLGEDRLRFEVITPDWLPADAPPWDAPSPPDTTTTVAAPVVPAPWDAVVILDVLYLMGTGRALSLLEAAARVVAPGGRVLVKEVDTTRHARMALLTAEEQVMTRLRITRGHVVEMLPIDLIEQTLRAAGMTTTRSDLSAGFHVPHCLVLGEQPTAQPSGSNGARSRRPAGPERPTHP